MDEYPSNDIRKNSNASKCQFVMSESTLTNLDGIPQYTSADTHSFPTSMIRPINAENTSKSMTIIVQNPFDDSSNSLKYHHDPSFHPAPESHNHISQHPVRFNQELLDNFGISVPVSKQAGTVDHQSTTSLIPLPSPLSNNLGVNIHSMNQPSLTPTMIGTYPIQSYPHFDSHHHQPQQVPPGMYLNNPRPMIGKLNPQTRPTNGTSPMIVRYPATQQYAHQMIKPRMIPPNAYGTSPQVILPQQTPIIYDPNPIYRTNGQPSHHLPPDDNILKSLLQINPQMNPEIAAKSRTIDQPPPNAPKSRKKRKPNDLNASFEDDQPARARKRKKKGTEETEKFVEYSLQQLRDLPMLTPLEPLIENKDDLSIHLPEKKSIYQGKFGDVFIKNLPDYYRPDRRAPPIILPSSLSKTDRRFRLCSNLLDRPPNLPSPPLLPNASEKLFELTKDKTVLHGDESIISTSTSAEDDQLIPDNIHLLQTLSSSYENDLRPLSPVIEVDEIPLEKTDRSIVDGPDKVSVTLTLTTEAANNVQSVMAAVADLLQMAYPTTFDVHQSLTNNNCTCSSTINNSQTKDFLSLTPSSQISTINRAASIYKIGRETSTSIQTLIDTQPKHCRHCSQHLTAEHLFKKRLNELPVNLRESTPNAEPFIYFCNEQCFTTYSQQQQTVVKVEPMDVIAPILKRQDQIVDNKHWKRWDPSLSVTTYIPPSNTDEINQLITDIRIPLSPNAKQDKRVCVFCHGVGDMTNNGPGRLLNLDIGQWCHLNCALWSAEVYETRCGALMGVDQAYSRSILIECVICKQTGSSLSCFFPRCSNKYHLNCAIEHGCVFYKNKTIMCPMHASKSIPDDEIMEDKTVTRKVWINRDEIKQIQDYMNDEHDDKSYILRIGSLILHNIGQLLPHQLQSSVFHNRNFIYPVGYTVTRFYWSMHHPNRRCAYTCSIIDMDNRPMFRIRVRENEQIEEYCDVTAKGVWQKAINVIDQLRRKHGLVKMFSVYITGEDLFGLSEPHIIRLIESLPGVEMLQNYAFKYGRLQLFDMPLTVNPTGCARSEPKLCTHFRRHAQTLTSSHAARSALPRTVLGIETNQVPYVKQFVLSKSTQYRKLKTEWRQNIYLAKSRIQGLGLFAARDLEKHTMVIEYIGELIRNEVANNREKHYEQQNRGIYMFRLDDDNVVDATMSGCLARYINHSCEPNSIAEVVQIEKENKIIIITNRRISKGEELMYDYKFDFEEDSKIPCLCGAVNCRKWMN